MATLAVDVAKLGAPAGGAAVPPPASVGEGRPLARATLDGAPACNEPAAGVERAGSVPVAPAVPLVEAWVDVAGAPGVLRDVPPLHPAARLQTTNVVTRTRSFSGPTNRFPTPPHEA